MIIADKLKTIAENEPKVFEAGKKSQYDEFWDTFQDHGNRKDYRYAFSDVTWTEDLLKPKYKNIQPELVGFLFSLCPIKDLRKHLADNGVKFDFSKAWVLESIGRGGGFETFPEISTISASNIAYLFYGANQLKDVEKVILKSEGNQSIGNTWFGQCKNLIEVRFEGVIGSNVGFPDSPDLSYDTLASLMGVLKRYDEGSNSKTLTLHATAKAKLSGTDKAYITQKGWTLA